MEQSQASAAIESGLVKEPSTMQSCLYHLLGDFIDGVLLVFGSIDLIALQRPLKKNHSSFQNLYQVVDGLSFLAYCSTLPE